MRTTDSNFAVEKLIDFNELDDEQKSQVEKEFKKKIWMENSLFYNYYENDSFWAGWAKEKISLAEQKEKYNGVKLNETWNMSRVRVGEVFKS